MEETRVKSPSISKNISSKFEVLENILHQTIYKFRDLVYEFEQMHLQTEKVKLQLAAQSEKCESKCCAGSEELKKVIQSKDNIIQVVASTLTKLNETKNLNIINELFNILYGDSKSPVNEAKNRDIISNDIHNQSTALPSLNNDSQNEMLLEHKNDSLLDIEGTPAGRCSPIIQSKKFKASTPNTKLRDKKKYATNWLTPEKNTKLTRPTTPASKAGGRLRQNRLNFIKLKPSDIVDLTSSPQFSMGRNSQDRRLSNNMKMEVLENEDTILPSPTSGAISYPIFKTVAKESPQKLKNPMQTMQANAEMTGKTDSMQSITDEDVTNAPDLEESANLLMDYHNGLISPKKCVSEKKSAATVNDSISLLQRVNRIDCNNTEHQVNSPSKRPLADNVNFGNVPAEIEASLSILRHDRQTEVDFERDTRRTKSEIPEPLYKEPTVRKKAEKRALPGWSCDRCKNFYGELYKENPEMLSRKMDECSKHRGRNNPARPRTPPGFWNPRWDVPDDTEEFNRRNNAL